MSNSERLLGQLIKYKENDMKMDRESEYRTEEDEHYLNELIMNLIKYYHDIRYCTRRDCSCSPEKGVEFHYNKIKHWIKETNTSLFPIPWKTIEEIIEGE